MRAKYQCIRKFTFANFLRGICYAERFNINANKQNIRSSGCSINTKIALTAAKGEMNFTICRLNKSFVCFIVGAWSAPLAPMPTDVSRIFNDCFVIANEAIVKIKIFSKSCV